jgi:DNA-binding NarL/FixJ family response regulator
LLEILTCLVVLITIRLSRIGNIKKESLAPQNTKELFAFADLKEREIFFLIDVLKDKKYEEIAYKYNVSLSTVKQELISAYKKLGVCNQKEFIKKYGNIEIIE